MGMKDFLIKRTLQTVITIFVVMTVLFFIFRVMPGDPAMALVGPGMTHETVLALREAWGLDKPLHEQYGHFVINMFRGDFGISFQYGAPVFDIVSARFFPTVLLFGTAVLLQYTLGIYLGKFIAWRRGSRAEGCITSTGLFLYAMPTFWVGMMAIWIFSYQLGLFPVGKMLTPEVWATGGVLERILDILHHLFLPLMCLTIWLFASAMLVMRASMLDVLRQDYIVTAKAKGLSEKEIRDRHAARNAMLPMVTAIALSIGFAMSGNVLVERVFSWPGLGDETVRAVLNLDFPLLQASFFLITLIVLLANFAADVLYAYVDPRVRY